jgi:type I restriction enzyme R subunit
MSQFAFLRAEFPDIFDHAARAKTLAHADPRGVAFYSAIRPVVASGDRQILGQKR